MHCVYLCKCIFIHNISGIRRRKIRKTWKIIVVKWCFIVLAIAIIICCCAYIVVVVFLSISWDFHPTKYQFGRRFKVFSLSYSNEKRHKLLNRNINRCVYINAIWTQKQKRKESKTRSIHRYAIFFVAAQIFFFSAPSRFKSLLFSLFNSTQSYYFTWKLWSLR